MNDTKIKLIRKMPDGDSILVLWIGLLCLAMKSGKPGIIEIGDGIPFTPETLSTELDMKLNTVKLGLKIFQDFKMIELWSTGEQYIINFEKHQKLTKIIRAKELSRASSQRFRDKQKQLSDGHVTISDKTDKDKDKDKDKEKEKDNICAFEKFWELYDYKKNKSKCSTKWKYISKKDKLTIFETLPKYIKNTPDKQFRKHPLTYLNGECWNDEIIKSSKTPKSDHSYIRKKDTRPKEDRVQMRHSKHDPDKYKKRKNK